MSDPLSDNKQAAKEWTCPHGTIYTGSEEFISGARNAHSEMEQRGEVVARGGRRSLNDIAYDILQKAPEVEPLVEEWFAATSAARNREATR